MDVVKVVPGAKAEFTTPATGDEVFTGTVASVSPIATSLISAPAGDSSAPAGAASTSGAGSVTFPVEITVTGGDAVRLGSTAKVTIIRSEARDVVAIPSDAIYELDGAKAVLVVDENNTIVERKVVTGTTNDFDVEITAGLNEGDRLITLPDKYRDQIGSHVDVQ